MLPRRHGCSGHPTLLPSTKRVHFLYTKCVIQIRFLDYPLIILICYVFSIFLIVVILIQAKNILYAQNSFLLCILFLLNHMLTLLSPKKEKTTPINYLNVFQNPPMMLPMKNMHLKVTILVKLFLRQVLLILVIKPVSVYKSTHIYLAIIERCKL